MCNIDSFLLFTSIFVCNSEPFKEKRNVMDNICLSV